jgi:hypothetical protein
MSIQISPETEARLVDEARRRGIAVEVLVERLLSERQASMIAGNRPTPELPIWHLGGAGSLHRRDIYDDVG